MKKMAYLYRGDFYCPECIRQTPHGVRDEEDEDKPTHCTTCYCPLDKGLTGTGETYVYEEMLDVLMQGPVNWGKIKNFPPVHPAYRTADVIALMNGIFADAAHDRLPILADALQDAGFDDGRFLGLLRVQKPGELIDLEFLESAISGEGRIAGFYFNFCRMAEMVRGWCEDVAKTMYPGDDDGFGMRFLALTSPDLSVEQAIALLGEYQTDPDARCGYVEWDLVVEHWQVMHEVWQEAR